MTEFFQRFSLRAIKFNWQVITALLIIWVAILTCAISSIFAQPFSKRQRLFWLAIVIGVPLFGLLAYLPFSFKKEEMPHIFFVKSRKSKKRRSGQTTGTSDRNT